MEALRFFGDAGTQYIVDDFAAHRIRFEEDSNYILGQVQQALSVLCDDGAALIIETVRREIARA